MGPTGTSYCRSDRPLPQVIKGVGYLRGGAGCVTTAAWWCQKQPPRPRAAAAVMVKAIKMRIAFPSFYLVPPTNGKLLGQLHRATNKIGLLLRRHNLTESLVRVFETT